MKTINQFHLKESIVWTLFQLMQKILDIIVSIYMEIIIIITVNLQLVYD